MMRPVDESSKPSPAVWRSSLLTLGVPVPMLISAVDAAVLPAAQNTPHRWVVFGVYLLFVLQTAALGQLVGWQARRQLAWWGILIWGLLLVNLQVFAISAGRPWTAINIVGVAFASAQVGAILCFAVLGTLPARLRLPSAAIALALVTFFAVALNAQVAWYLTLLVQSVATALVCLLLRSFAFRIERRDLPADLMANRLQFSIRHLFYWTTGVAVVVGLGRLIGWQHLLTRGMTTSTLLDLVVYCPVLTIASILALWGALGREWWVARAVLLLPILPATGLALGHYTWSSARSNWGLFHARTRNDSIELAIVWMILATALLAGLLLALRASGHQLFRR